jgi:hypothetical protein
VLVHVVLDACCLQETGPVSNLLQLLHLNCGIVGPLQVRHELLVSQHIMGLEPNSEAREKLVDQFVGVSHRQKSGRVGRVSNGGGGGGGGTMDSI